ncbi:MAG: copper homeostasis protein CutC, partial [Blastococcus sp.]
MTLVEICVDDVAGARTAELAGADRIELCADLLEGGITPSAGMLERTLDAVTRVGVQVLIRPRG